MKHWMVAGVLMTSIIQGVAAPKIIAHRGESCDAPENTMAAFRLAAERHVDGIECDVYLSRDEQIFCFHDATLKRYVPAATQTVSSLTYAQLKQFDVGARKNAAFAGERIPLLRDLLTLAAEGRQIYVEVKCGPEIVPYLKTLFASLPNVSPQRVVFITFKAPVVTALKKAMPEYTAYYLASVKKDKEGALTPSAEALIAQARKCLADGVDISGEFVTAEYVNTLKAAGLSVHVWTIDKPERAQALAAMGVESITTNRGGEMMRLLGSK